MSPVRLLAAVLTTAVVAPVLALTSAPTASAACPTGTVGRVQTVFNPNAWSGSAEEMTWYLRGQGLQTDIGMSSDLVVDVALWPMDEGQNRFTVEAKGGPDFIEVDLQDGKVSLWTTIDADPWYEHRPDAMTYEPGTWNNLRLRFDLDAGMAYVSMNGQHVEMPSRAGSELLQIWWENHHSTSVKDTDTGYIDDLEVTSVQGDNRTTLYSEDFEELPAERPGPGTLELVESPALPPAAAGCKERSTVSLVEKQTSEKITLTGGVQPASPGRPVTVTLLKKKGGKFVRVGKARRITLDHESSFRTKFAQPSGARTCRATVGFGGTPAVTSGKATRTFAC